LPAADDTRPASRIVVAVIVAAVAILVIYVRVRYAGAPLERDEGEYAYAGQLILQGIPPYELAYNMKFPGTYYAYAALMAVFGESAWGIRIGLLVWHLATVTVLFLLARRLAGTLAASMGAAFFALLALDRWSMGVFAHATHFVLLPALGALLAVQYAMTSGRRASFIAAGALAGAAVIMKQQAFVFALLVAALTVWSAREAAANRGRIAVQRLATVALGMAAPFALLVLVLALEGVLGRFWFWTFEYAAAYVAQTPWSAADDMFTLAWSYITRANWMIWYAGLAGVLLLWTTGWRTDARVFLTAWLAAALLSIAPGLYFRPHYFILLMPVAAVFAGVLTSTLSAVAARRLGPGASPVVAVAVVGLLGASYVANESGYLFRDDDAALMNAVYESNPFAEAVDIGRYIKEHSAADDRIAVLGSEPEIYFYADRKSATGYIYTYALMERQPFAASMQEEMIREIEAAKPAFLVFVGVASSWAALEPTSRRIFTWANEYTTKCYERVGVADIDRRRGSTIRWNDGYQPASQFQVLTFKRTCE
jgi:4-amino-4-deoxy-L-arabinose transferase-like glycosyltransferase